MEHEEMDGFSDAKIIHSQHDPLNRVESRISDFRILCIYDVKTKTGNINSLKAFAKKLIKGEKADIRIFNESQECETFIVWEQSYQQNKELFQKLRMAARDDVFSRMATGIVAYFLSEYATVIQSSMSRYPELKNPHLLDISVQKIDTLLKNNTFLAQEASWETFNNWFRSYLTSQVVQQMEREVGKNKLEKLERSVLNEWFYILLTQQVQMNSPMMAGFIQNIEHYMQQWMAKIIPSLDQERLSGRELETFLGMQHLRFANNTVALPITLTEGYLSIMSNAAYQSVREAVSNRFFERVDAGPWPTAHIRKGTVRGKVQMRPYACEHSMEESVIHRAWDATETLSELDVDVFDALCGFFLTNAVHHKDIIEIKMQDLLSIRGLQLKRSGNGRRGGYEPKQVRQVLKALSNIQDIWVDFEEIIVYEKGKPMEVQLQGRTFIFLDDSHHVFDVSKQLPENKLIFTVAEVFTKFLHGSGRQVALLPLKTLHYNPRQMQWEKKLIRYMSWRWRTQAKKGDYEKPHKIGSLLKAIGKQINKRTPSRTRERLEQALDQLQEDKLIASWEYVDWNEMVVSANGWARLWENAKVIITPPENIPEQYRTITRKNRNNGITRQFSSSVSELGSRLKEFRKKSGFTLAETAMELELSAAYVSTIERGLKMPSVKVQDKILYWIQG